MKAALKEIFVRELGLKPGDFSEELTYNSIPEWDSASHMAVILAIEERFDITLESDEIVKMTSIPKILSILEVKGAVIG
jgi:acyl carrier protein